MSEWTAVAVDLNGNVRAAEVPFVSLKYHCRLNSFCSTTFDCDVQRPEAVELLPGERAIKLYRKDPAGVNQLRFHGKIAEPHDETQDVVSVFAADPFWWAAHRRIYGVKAGAFSYTKGRRWGTTPPARDFAPDDASDIAWQLIEDQRLYRGTGGDLRFRNLVSQPSVVRSREYEPGKVLAEAIVELAEVDDGFWFTVLPVDDVPGKHADFVTKYPLSGGDRPEVRFEYGDDTLGTVESYTRSSQLPLNGVLATGQNAADKRIVSRVDDAGSRARFDLLEDEVAHSTATKTATLTVHAQGEIREDVRYIYSATPTPYSGEQTDPLSFALFDSFDVGDVVRLTIHHGRVNITDVRVRILEAEVEVSDSSDVERLTSLVFATLLPGEPS